MLTTRVPDSWQDLQNQVGRILMECGFAVEIERAVPLVRGQASIDVYAEEIVKGRRNRIFCECKYWKTAVPQHVIHSFRTVAADAGANVGYIISLAGFQAGALEAVAQTNIRLVTWEEFLAEFEATWLSAHFVPTVTDRLDPLMTYVEPLAPAWWGKLSESEQADYLQAHERYQPLGYLAMMTSRWVRMLEHRNLPDLPLRANGDDAFVGGLPDDILDAAGYQELLDAMLARGRAATTEFRVFRDKAVPQEAASGPE